MFKGSIRGVVWPRRELRRLVDHRCGEYWCSICQWMVNENHLCYVQPIKERRQERVTEEEEEEEEEEEDRKERFRFCFLSSRPCLWKTSTWSIWPWP